MSTSVEASYVFRIADISIRLRASDASLLVLPGGAARGFLVDPATRADVELTVEHLPSSLPPPGEILFDSGGVWTLAATGDGYRIDCSSEVFGADPYKIALFDREFRSGRVLMADSVAGATEPLEYPLDELLVNHLLGMGSGIEIHACGVVDRDGRALLFAGQSGDGKTTISRFWQQEEGVVILSDDRIVIREQEGRFIAYGTPWHGEAALSTPASAVLAEIHILVQADRNELAPLSPAQASARLYARAFPVFYDRLSSANTIAFLDRLTHAVPANELRFVRDASVIAFLRDEWSR